MSYTDKLTALSNSIKVKNPNYTGNLSLAKMKEAVDGISKGVDTSIITATAADCLSTKKILLSNGTLVSGTIATRSAVTTTLSKSTTSYTIPAGYYSSTGKVSIVSQTKTVTPSSSSQSITADSGKVLTGVTVNGHGKKTRKSGTIIGDGSTEFSINLGVATSSLISSMAIVLWTTAEVYTYEGYMCGVTHGTSSNTEQDGAGMINDNYIYGGPGLRSSGNYVNVWLTYYLENGATYNWIVFY